MKKRYLPSLTEAQAVHSFIYSMNVPKKNYNSTLSYAVYYTYIHYSDIPPSSEYL